MASIFDTNDRAALVARIQRLGPATPRQWGKMDVAQMLAHCQCPLRIALGDDELERNIIGVLFGWLAKRQLLAPKPFGKNLPTAPQFKVVDPRVFEKERDTLLALVKRLGDGGPAVLTQKPHPFFGALTVAEWDGLQWKHLDHHLRQFGV